MVLPLTVTIEVEQAAYTAVADNVSKIAANVFICFLPEIVILVLQNPKIRALLNRLWSAQFQAIDRWVAQPSCLAKTFV